MPKGLAAFVFSDITAVTEEAELYKKGAALGRLRLHGPGSPRPAAGTAARAAPLRRCCGAGANASCKVPGIADGSGFSLYYCTVSYTHLPVLEAAITLTGTALTAILISAMKL